MQRQSSMLGGPCDVFLVCDRGTDFVRFLAPCQVQFLVLFSRVRLKMLLARQGSARSGKLALSVAVSPAHCCIVPYAFRSAPNRTDELQCLPHFCSCCFPSIPGSSSMCCTESEDSPRYLNSVNLYHQQPDWKEWTRLEEKYTMKCVK